MSDGVWQSIIAGIFLLINSYIVYTLNKIHTKVNGMNKIIASTSKELGRREGIDSQKEIQEKENNKINNKGE